MGPRLWRGGKTGTIIRPLAIPEFAIRYWSSTMRWLGLDIGGANLKAADGHGFGRSMSFALWREPRRLVEPLRQLLQGAPAVDGLAVTMTGELCDCFASKTHGVQHILTSVAEIAHGRPILVYQCDGQFVSLGDAQRKPLAAAAANWHALATFACRFVEHDFGMLIDIGSTTTDIVPLSADGPIPTAFDDTSRLIAGELVYMGVGRTPLCAVVDAVPWRAMRCPLASELFATTADAYVTLGHLPEDRHDTATADGRPRTREHARARLARSICVDAGAFYAADARAVSLAVRQSQEDRLAAACEKVVAAMAAPPSTFVLSGSGEFLARRLLRRSARHAEVASLADLLGPEVSGCGTAHALAVLAHERIPN